MQGVASGIKKRGTKGVFKAAAQRAGMSTRAYAEKKKHASGKTGRRNAWLSPAEIDAPRRAPRAAAGIRTWRLFTRHGNLPAARRRRCSASLA